MLATDAGTAFVLSDQGIQVMEVTLRTADQPTPNPLVRLFALNAFVTDASADCLVSLVDKYVGGDFL